MIGTSSAQYAGSGTSLTAFAPQVAPTAMPALSLSGFVRNIAPGAVGHSLKGAKIAFVLHAGQREERRHNGNGLR